MSVPPQAGPVQTGPFRAETRAQGVTLTDIDIPFGRLVMFFVKAALAAIPATIIVWLVLGFIMMLFGALFDMHGGRWMMMG